MNNNIEIVRSSVIGYCMGVKKAVESAINAVKDYPSSNIYTFGQLIHNPTTLKMLESLNINAIDEKDYKKASTLQIEMSKKVNELAEIYKKYKKNIF